MPNSRSGILETSLILDNPVLYIFGGLPGTGKSTLASAIARERGAVYLRIDTVEQALRNAGISAYGEGYLVAYALAEENLRLGNNVVADSVNPLPRTRAAWRNVAGNAAVSCVEIEVICSDIREHQSRVESRSTDISGLKLPTWQGVQERVYEPWTSDHITMDTAGRTVGESMRALMTELQRHEMGAR